MTNDDSIEIDIRPEVNILSVLRHLNYRPWFALAEFVDNSLASFLSARSEGANDRDSVTVDITLDATGNGRIAVIDDAYGIPAADFPRAFRAADVPPDRTGLSEFGMGMKSAASWFAKNWTVRTSVPGEGVQRAITFNLDAIVENGINSLRTEAFPADPSAHFTIVELRGLNHVPQGRTIGKIRSHLASIYRIYLRRSDLILTLNGEEVSYKEVDVLSVAPAWDLDGQETRWSKDVSLELGGGRRVEGFVALRAIGSTAEAGLALFRRDRLIQGSFDEAYRPIELFKRSNSYSYQRIFGELELTGFEVSHTKDGFRWDEHEDTMLLALESELERGPINILKQAEDYRVNAPEPDERGPITDAANRLATSLQKGLPAAIDQAAQSGLPDGFIADFLTGEVADESTSQSQLQPIERQVKITADDGLWLINLKATLDDASPDWLQVGSQYEATDLETGRTAHSLDVEINFAHPFTRQYIGAGGENSELFIAIASGIGMALALGKKSGARSQFVLNYLNLILSSTFR
jgi:hypothetical protein